MEALSRLVPVARIVRTHGVRGALKVHPYGETLAEATAGLTCYAEPPPSCNRLTLTLSRIRTQGRHLVIEFHEISTMEAAQTVIGSELLLPEDMLPPPSEGEYYHYQLLGLRVVTVQREELGSLKNIIETGAHDIYVVEREGREFLLPAVEEVIVEVDLAKGVIVVDPPPGLLDDL